ncbi:MAG: biopolymer transporter ExbD [Spirochaetia bacterium]|nr:biopolymer transporter ExbD [Spirochaetia bacterium]
MAIQIKRKRRSIEEIPLSSTADIAFLLIVFYLASSSLLEFRGVSLPLPKKDAPPMEILKENIVKVYINEEGNILHEKESYSLPEIIRILAEKRKANPEIVVILKVKPEAPSEMVPKFIREIQKINIEKFSMSMDP